MILPPIRIPRISIEMCFGERVVAKSASFHPNTTNTETNKIHMAKTMNMDPTNLIHKSLRPPGDILGGV